MTAPDPRVGEIEARLSAATPGPWEIIGGNEYLTGVDVCVGSAEEGGIRLRDAEFIAHSPSDVSYLLAELRKAREALARVEGVAEWIKDHHGDYISREIEERIRAAVAAANGDGRG